MQLQWRLFYAAGSANCERGGLPPNKSPLMYLFSYIRGDFVYCPVLRGLFTWPGVLARGISFRSVCLPDLPALP